MINIFLYLGLLFILAFCGQVKNTSPPTMVFENIIDTEDREIKIQDKKNFYLKKVGVYASNRFDGARLNDFRLLNDSTAVAYIEPENEPINPSPYYAFKIWADTLKTFYVSLEYPKLYKNRYLPKILKNSLWETIDSLNYLESGNGSLLRLTLNKKSQVVAAQPIYSYLDVMQWTDGLTTNFSECIEKKNIGVSRLGKDIPVLDITIGNKNNKPIVVLLTRQHPPELTGFMAFQNFLKTVLSSEKYTENFLNNYRVLAFPILNPDGVDLGHWRHNAAGVDLNRDWANYNQPEVRQVVQALFDETTKNNTNIVLGIDFHSTYNDVFYTNPNEDKVEIHLPHFKDKWLSSLEKEIEGYKVNESSSNSLKPVSKGWFLRAHKAVGITYEVGEESNIEDIKIISRVSAEQMMRILLE